MVNPVFTTDELIMCRAEAYLLRQNPDMDKAMADINVVLNSMTGQTFNKEFIIAYYKSLSFMPTNVKSDDDRSIKKGYKSAGYPYRRRECGEYDTVHTPCASCADCP